MTALNPSQPVLVTGGTGYLASWIIKKLLQQGTPVHATVRDLDTKNKYAHLLELADQSTGSLKLFEADLLKEGSFTEAMKDCVLVFHTASPFFISKIKDPQKQLVEPAEMGTANVLRTALQTETVKRVVLTSSVAAVYGDAADAETVPGRTFTEKNWNTSSGLAHQPYSYSKTRAEKKAWEMVQMQDQWDLVVLNPAFIMGPSLNKSKESTSTATVIRLANGETRFGAPDFWYGVVDVRDVAEAHLKAAYLPAASGRYILCSEHASFPDLGKFLREKFGNSYPFPKSKLPKFLFWALGPVFGIPRKMISKNVGYRYQLSNTKSIKELGLDYLPAKTSIQEHFEQIIRDGLL